MQFGGVVAVNNLSLDIPEGKNSCPLIALTAPARPRRLTA